ncbi:MAG: T9SS C-terminal target domain-containing protein [Bacteroidales bacterium]|nr:T9SS C-terminal target domain-containing protein [Bacteroidales bacterium]
MKRRMLLAALLLCVGLWPLSLAAQDKPVIKVDFNEPSRKDNEVLEPGFTAWAFPKDTRQASLTVEGVTFTVTSEQNMRAGWNKAFVQEAVENSKLTGDGVVFDPKTLDGVLELGIKGLPAGTHTIQTYHNSWQDPASYTGWPIHILVGDEEKALIHRTFRKTSSAEAAIAMFSFQVLSDSDEVIIKFRTSIDDDDPDDLDKTSYDVTPLLNGFELNTVSAAAQSRRPSPSDGDMHIDAEDGSFLLKWSPADSAVSRHYLYFGTDSAAVAGAVASSAEFVAAKEYADTTWLAEGLSNLKTYFWRVDEEKDGVVTPGFVWSFRPRHLAFRTAEGYGRFATGGRGGRVVYVTNLNSSGPGSFRYAVEKEKGPRTIVFAVSGIIDLSGRLTVSDKYVTIAGQTAPGKGICFRNGAMGFGDESITRFIRNRVGSGTTYDGMGLRGRDHSIVDHCSISWSIDEGFSCREAKNVTLQHTMIAEPLNVANHDKYGDGSEHGFSAVFCGDIGSFHHNVMAHARGRNPRMDGGMDGNGYYAGRLDIFNNVVYNWSSYGGNGEAHEANFVNNYYKMGPQSSVSDRIIVCDVNQRGGNKGSESYYYNGNALAYKDGRLRFDGTQPHGASGQYGGSWQLVNEMTIDWEVWVDKPFFPSFARIESAQDAYKSVLSDVGCTMPVFDDHDRRVIREIQQGSYTYSGSVTGYKGVIDTEADCGGYEDYGAEVVDLDAFDTDRDGLPNWWEQLYGTDPKGTIGDFTDSDADPDGDGYTMLDDYLEWMARPHYQVSEHSTATVDLSDLVRNYKAPVGFSVMEDGHAVLQISGQEVVIKAPSDGWKGVEFITLKGIDADGSEALVYLAVASTDAPTPVPTVSADPAGAEKLYDIFGREVKSADKPGLYFSRNRKILQK